MKSRVVVITEDPCFISDVRRALDSDRSSVVGCLGPGQARCAMEVTRNCPLVARSAFAVVDSPTTGVFFDHYHGIPSISYAERLAEAHPTTEVILCTAAQHDEPNAFMSRHDALKIIKQRCQRGDVDEGS